MSRFVQPHLATVSSAPGVATRKPAQPLLVARFEGSKTLAGMLLAGVLAALLVAADQLIDTWVDGHLFASWVALWTVTFVVLAWLARPLRRLSLALSTAYARHAQAQAERRTEDDLWELAQHDHRVMAELMHAWSRTRA